VALAAGLGPRLLPQSGLYSYEFTERRHDVGTTLGFLETTMRLACTIQRRETAGASYYVNSAPRSTATRPKTTPTQER